MVEVEAQPIVADPLRLYDFCPITDGSAGLVFTTEERAAELADDYAVVSGIDGDRRGTWRADCEWLVAHAEGDLSDVDLSQRVIDTIEET